jgi:hypothetical protein
MILGLSRRGFETATTRFKLAVEPFVFRSHDKPRIGEGSRLAQIKAKRPNQGGFIQ